MTGIVLDAATRQSVARLSGADQARQVRKRGVVALGLLLYPVIGLDWHYSFEGAKPWLFGTLPTMAISVVLFAVVCWSWSGSPAFRRSLSGGWSIQRRAWLGLGVVMIAERLHTSPFDTVIDNVTWPSWFAILMVPLWSVTGFAFGWLRTHALWFLRRLAWICAALSGIGFAFRLAGSSEYLAVIGPPSWPARFALLFGFCWFLAMSVSGRARWIDLVGLVLSCLEVVVTFHKPFVFGSAAAYIAILLSRRDRSAVVRWIRMSAILVIAAFVFLGVDALSGGEVSQKAVAIVYDRFFHIRPGESEQRLGVMLEDASGGRLQEVWPRSLEIFEASPLLGSGWEQSVRIHGGQELSLHNGYLDALASVGIIGTVLLAGSLLQSIRLLIRAVAVRRQDPEYVAAIGYTAALLAVNVASVQRHYWGELLFSVFVLSVFWGMSASVPIGPSPSKGRS